MEQGLRTTFRSALAALALAGLCAAPGVAAAMGPDAIAAGEGARRMTSADALLDALERADVDIRTFSSELIYDRRFRLQGDRHIRWGKLYFRVDPAASPGERAQRTFAVRFETLSIPDDEGDVRRDDESLWIFDGQWLIEKREVERQFVKRQIARPEDPVDPLRLGEGPLPIPIGQKKADILSRYDVVLLAPDDGVALTPEQQQLDAQAAAEALQMASFVKNTYQIKLTPKPGAAEQEEFVEVRLWYMEDSLLPRAARTINRAGDESLVLLAGARVNEALPKQVMDVEIPDPAQGWAVQIDEGRFGSDQDPDSTGVRR